MPPKKKAAKKSSNGATVGYEAELWQMADALRGSMDAAEYKHVVLGLIFLKYISDAFEEKHAQLVAEKDGGADPEDPDEYRAVNIFWVPPEARWPHLKGQAKQPTIGQIVDDAMAGIERDNPSLKGVLPKDYARPALDKQRLGQLVDLVSNIDFSQPSPQTPLPKGEGLSSPRRTSTISDGEGLSSSRRTSAISEGEGLSASRCTSTISDGEGLSASRRTSAVSVYRGRHAHDLLGRVYEYFLSQFASAEGKKGGEFYTPRCVVRLLVEMIEPYKGRVYDPCCGSSGMFVQSEEFIAAHGGKLGDISIYGQESNYTTWRLAKMNLAIRGVDAQIAHGDTFHNDRHPDLKADYILANPPFNISDWGGDRLRDDKRWQYGVPPSGNANFAWVQHMVHHLAPKGVTGFVLANGSMSSNQSGEGEIRKNLVEAGLVDCMVALPGQLFYSTQIPACLWFLRRGKPSPLSPLPMGEGNNSIERKRNTNPSPIGRGDRGEGSVLFIDARKLGSMVDRTHRELTAEDIQKIADTYRAWRAQGLTPAQRGTSGDGSVPTMQDGDVLISPRPLGEGQGEGIAYTDIPGFCKSASLDEIRKHGHVLTPGRYVGAEEVEDDGEPFEEKMTRFVTQLREQQAEAARLDKAIWKNMKDLGYGG